MKSNNDLTVSGDNVKDILSGSDRRLMFAPLTHFGNFVDLVIVLVFASPICLPH